MKNARLVWLAVAAGACSNGSDLAALDPAKPLHVQLKLRGIATSAYRNVLLDVKDVQVTAGGRALAVTPPQVRMDLADTSQGWVAGEFDVPAGTDRVHIAMTFDDYGGFEDSAGAGEIDARTVPVQIDASIAELGIHGKAVVQLDVARSLISAGAERRLLLPSLSVAY